MVKNTGANEKGSTKKMEKRGGKKGEHKKRKGSSKGRIP